MKFTRSLFVATAIMAAINFSNFALADQGLKDGAAVEDTGKGELVRVTYKDAAWAAKATAEYPTDVCVVSEDKLGADMGKPQDFIYREKGKADRLVRFCCKDCAKDFNEDPAKYLGMIDAAAAKKKAVK